MSAVQRRRRHQGRPARTPVVPGGTYDLVVDSVALSPASPAAGDAVTFSAVVRNAGSVAVPSGTVMGVLFSVDGTPTNWSDTYTGGLAAGATHTCTANSGPGGIATWSATGGGHTVTAWVDDINRFPDESPKDNNTLAASFSVTSGGSGGGDPTGVQAVQAEDFRRSIGVNTHWHYTGTRYYDAPDSVQALLVLSDMLCYRDYSIPDLESRYLSCAAAGLKAALMCAKAYHAWPFTLAQMFTTAKHVYQAGGLDYFASTNEPDINGWVNDDPVPGAGWAANTRNWQAQLSAMVRADGVTAGARIAGPSITWAYNHAALGNIAAWCDVVDLHPYPGGVPPESLSNSHPLIAEKASANASNAPGKGAIATETGYHNQVPSDTGHLGISEAGAAIYAPRLYAYSFFDAAIERSYWYEFVDEGTSGGEARFGLVHSDLTVKPAYTALKNMCGLLKDPGATFTPGVLNYGVSGGNAATHHHLMQKRNGEFWLIVWQETSVFTQGSNVDVDPANVTLTINLSTVRTSATQYVPNDGTSPIHTDTAVSSITVTSQEKVTLIKVVP